MGLWNEIRIFCHDTLGKEVITCWPEANLQLPILQFMNERYSFVDTMTSLGDSGISPGMLTADLQPKHLKALVSLSHFSLYWRLFDQSPLFSTIAADDALLDLCLFERLPLLPRVGMEGFFSWPSFVSHTSLDTMVSRPLLLQQPGRVSRSWLLSSRRTHIPLHPPFPKRHNLVFF